MKTRPTLFPLLAVLLGTACAAGPQKGSPSTLPLVGFALRDRELERERQRDSIRAPGPEHRYLDALVGDFRAAILAWPSGEEPPQTSGGTSSNTWIAGGRFLVCELSGDIGGRPWERRSVLGYDRGRESFVETRVDSSTTEMPGIAVGRENLDKGEIVFTRTVEDSVLGKSVSLREILTIESWNAHRLELWFDPAGGEAYKALEIRYERIR